MAASDSEIYRALLDLSRAIAGEADLERLCDALASSLRRIVTFDSLGVVLYDAEHDEFRLRAITTDRLKAPTISSAPIDGDHPTARVWREQKPLVLPWLGPETPDAEMFQEAVESGILAVTLVPLSNGNRRLGVLGFGFTHSYSPDAQELEFLQRVASEFAVAVDGHLTRSALRRERDRIRALFDITTALVSKLPMQELFSAISQELCKMVQHDFAMVALLDKATGEIRLTALHSPTNFAFEPEETVARPEGLPDGEAIASGKPVTTTGMDFERFPSPLYRKYGGLGFVSNCSIPLPGRDGVAGVLDLSRKHPEPFTEDEVDILLQVARQIGIAIENSLAYREVSELKDRLATEKLYLEDQIRLDQNMGNMIGQSPAFESVLKNIQVVAPTDATVLIEGETGTGKELIARAIHDLSGRSKRSFIKVNCAAIPATLLESELFGHEKGSFTGAFAQKIGRFELAHQGTLFLDEVGEIPLELQSKLLRAIQEQELERLGGTRTINVDVRFVAATNRNLKQMVAEGKFRSDLYYRLHVFPLTVPPLRDRTQDIPLLIRFFTQKHARRMNRNIEEIPAAAIEALTQYSWPGNIRELQNVVERSVILSPGRVLKVSLPETPAGNHTEAPPRRDEEAERQQILAVLRECRGKVSGPDGAAARLGVRRTTLQSRMKRLGLERHFG